jgi:hypothetical protein
MPYSMPDHVAQDLKRLKETGAPRISRIRAIVKQAWSEAFSEVREGSGEVRQIVTESMATAFEPTQPLSDTSTVMPSVPQDSDSQPLRRELGQRGCGGGAPTQGWNPCTPS